MSDERLQALERRWRAGDIRQDAYLAQRVRLGGISQGQLELLAYLGHGAARVVVGDDMWWDGLDLWEVRFYDYNQWDGCIGLAGPFVLDPIHQWSPVAWRHAVELAVKQFPRSEPLQELIRRFVSDDYSDEPRDWIWNAEYASEVDWTEAVRAKLIPWVFDHPRLEPATPLVRIEPGGWGRPLEDDGSVRPLAKRLSTAKLKGLDTQTTALAAHLGHPGALRSSKRKPVRDDLDWVRGLAEFGGEVCARAALAVAWELHPAWHRLMRRQAQSPTRCLILAEALLTSPEDAGLRDAAAAAATRPETFDASLKGQAKTGAEPPYTLHQRWRARFAERVARWAAGAAATPDLAPGFVARPFEQARMLDERWSFPLVRTSRLRAAIVRQVLPWVLGISVPEPAARKKVTKTLEAETLKAASSAGTEKKKTAKKKTAKKKTAKKKTAKKKTAKKKTAKKKTAKKKTGRS